MNVVGVLLVLPDEPEVLVAEPPAVLAPDAPDVEAPPVELLAPPDEPPVLDELLLLVEPLVLDEVELLVELEVLVLVDVLLATAKIELAGFGIANVLCFPTESDWISKSKSTPINSKKVSLTVINRTSTET
jgi:hypothetical protein